MTNAVSFDAFLERIHEQDVLKWATNQRPDSDWICVMVMNATFFVNIILHHPIGCVGIELPPRIKLNKSIICLEKDNHGKQYVDNLSLFQCLGLHLGRDAMNIYTEYTHKPAQEFEGVTVDDLHKVETIFEVNIVVYELGDECAQLVRRSLGQYTNTMNINIHETHFSYIRNMKLYAHSYLCRKCGDSLWKQPYRLARHEMACEGDVRRVYRGGVYHPTPSVFQPMDDEGIHVVDILRYYPYRATFDFECFFDETNLPTDTDHLQWVARHVPLSVSVASNVPGYEAPRCFVTDGDSNKLVNTMMTYLQTISQAAFESLKPSYENELDKLKTLKEAWVHAENFFVSSDSTFCREFTSQFGLAFLYTRKTSKTSVKSGRQHV